MSNQRFPDWIKRPWGDGETFESTRELLAELGLCTVCQSARCPNMGECWANRTATFMLLGKVCTRNCRFCSVSHGKPAPVDHEEPARIAEAVRRLRLRHAVITSVTRDDLPDGGAAHFASTIRAIRAVCPGTTIEVLVPDFGCDKSAIACVTAARPEIFGHNVETVRRLYPVLRGGRYRYDGALDVLRTAAGLEPDTIIKSAFMVGHGETAAEIDETLIDLVLTGCDAVSIGQYLQPTPGQCGVTRFVSPAEFKKYETRAMQLGFKFAVAGPFVRSSYHSAEAAGWERISKGNVCATK